MNDTRGYLIIANLFNSLGNGLDGTLHIALDQDWEFLTSGFLQARHHLLEFREIAFVLGSEHTVDRVIDPLVPDEATNTS